MSNEMDPNKVIDLGKFRGKAPTPERLDMMEGQIKRLTMTLVQMANAQAALNDQVTRGNLTIEALVHCLLGSNVGDYRVSYEEFKKSGKTPDYKDVAGAILTSSKFQAMVSEIAGVWNEQEKRKQEAYAKAAEEADSNDEDPEAEEDAEPEEEDPRYDGPESKEDTEPIPTQPYVE
jgi:hypothetical protein